MILKEAADAAQRHGSLELAPMQALVVFRLVFTGEEPKQSALTELKPAARKKLMDAGLIDLEKRGRAHHIVLRPAAYTWAAEHLDAPIARTPNATPVLAGLLARLHEFLARSQVTLADILRAGAVDDVLKSDAAADVPKSDAAAGVPRTEASADRPAAVDGNADQPGGHVHRPDGHAVRPDRHADRAHGHADHLHVHEVHPDAHADRSGVQSDQQPVQADRLQGQADQPHAHADHPHGHTDHPDAHADRSDVQSDQQPVQADRLQGQADQPHAHADHPHGREAHPESHADHPDIPTDHPEARSPWLDSAAEQHIQEAYFGLTGGRPNQRVRLKDLRRRLPSLPRTLVDAALLQLQAKGALTLMQLDDPTEISRADELAAIDIIGHKRHIVYMGGQSS